ncbi:MAG: LytTR family DNA-binding domain-containing protein [Pseudomonadota bacterium]
MNELAETPNSRFAQIIGLDTDFLRFASIAFVLIAIIFAAIEPASSPGLGNWARLLFWLCHALLAIPALVLATRLLTWAPFSRRWPAWLSVSAAGVLAALLVAPGAYVVEQWFGVLEDDLSQSLVLAILDEFSGLAVPLTMSWLLVNMPRLLRLQISAPVRASRQTTDTSAPPEPMATSPSADETTADAAFLAKLPPALGRTLVSITSDLHYLHVHTVKGKTMLFGSLKEAEQQLDGYGQMIHRSHWVANDQVVSVRGRSGKMVCLLTDGRRLAVSRRRQADVLAYFGRDSTLQEDARN